MGLHDAAAHGPMSAGVCWWRRRQEVDMHGPVTESGWDRSLFHHLLLHLHPEGGWDWWGMSAHLTFQTYVWREQKCYKAKKRKNLVLVMSYELFNKKHSTRAEF